MEKTILLLRHGKSDWSADYQADMDRPLANRGKGAARIMGRFLVGVGQTPDRALVSPARRATQTFKRVMGAGGWSCSVQLEPELYNGSMDAVTEAIAMQPDTVSILAIVGHEPMGSDLLAWLIGSCAIKFPTAALAGILLNIESWQQLCHGEGQLQYFLPPRLLSRFLADTN